MKIKKEKQNEEETAAMTEMTQWRRQVQRSSEQMIWIVNR